MKALSIKQPWASLIIAGLKEVENRHRPWKHRGPLAIHASKSYDKNWCDKLKRITPKIYDIAKVSKTINGGIIGSVEMIDCVKSFNSDFFTGPYGYILKNPKECDLIPFKGSQGVFNIFIYSPKMKVLQKYYQGYYECIECGELFIELDQQTYCPTCKEIIMSF